MNARAPAFRMAVLVALCSSRAFADDTDALQLLLNQNVVSTASTESETAATAPATAVTLTAEDLRVYGIRTLAEAIRFLAVGVVATENYKTSELGTRGVLLPGDNGKHFLLLVDGHAVNDPLYGAARFDEGLGIPLEIIDHVEVIVGPGSVLYGSNAMLGVINVITRQAKDYRGGHVYGEYEPEGSARAGAGAGADFDLFGARARVTAAAEYFRRFGPDLHFDPQPPQVFGVTASPPIFRRGGPADGVWGGTVREAYFADAPKGILRLRVADFDVSLMASIHRRGVPYTSASTDVDFDDRESSEVDRAARLDVKHQATPSTFLHVTSRVYADGFDYQRRINRNALQGCFREEFETCQYRAVGKAHWLGIEERVSLNWLEDSSLVTLLGVDARMRWVSAKEDALDFERGDYIAPSTGIVNGAAGLVGPYLQQTYSPTAWLALDGGARLDIDPRFEAIASPRGAVSVTPFERTTMKAIYSQAFRSPTWDETDASGYRQARARTLEPEIVRSIEASIEQTFGTQRLMFGVYKTAWDNMIVPRQLTPEERSELQTAGEIPITFIDVKQYRNAANLSNYGWNASWDGSLAGGRLSYGCNATAGFARIDLGSGARPLEAAPRFFGNARLSYAIGGFAPTPGIAVSYLHDRLVDRAYQPGWSSVPTAPAAVELRGTLTGRIPGFTGLSYRLSAHYNTASYGAYVAGRVSSINSPLSTPTLIPIDRFSAFLGLRYDFAGGGHAGEGH